MDQLKRLASHFKNYWNTKGEDMDINVEIKPPNRQAAEEPKPELKPPVKPEPKPELKPPVKPELKPGEKPKEEPTDVVAESVNNLDDLVEKEIDRKVVINLKRIIEDAIRKTLGKTFQDMERSLRPEIEKEVAEQSKDVEKDIRDVMPIKALEEKVEEKGKVKAPPAVEALPKAKAPAEVPAPAVPPAPAPAAAAPVKASWVKALAQAQVKAELTSSLPKALTLSDGTVVQPLSETKAKFIKDGKDLGFEVEINPGVTEDDQIKLYETKLLELRKATENLEKIKEPMPVVPSIPVQKSEITMPEEGEPKEVTSMFRVSYHDGNSLENSYFVGSDGARVKVVSALRVIPAEVQEKIRKATEEKKEPEDIIEPEEAEKQIAEAVDNSMDKFVEWASQLPKITRSASMAKKAADTDPTWAINESEIPKVDMPKEGPFKSVDLKEAAEGEKVVDMPRAEKSSIKKFYQRLPGEGGGDVTTSINLQSAMAQKYQLMKKALEEKEEELKKTKEEFGKKDKELGEIKEKVEIDKTKGKVDQLMAELKKMKPVDPDKEKNILDILAKVDAKAVGQLLEVVKMIVSKEDSIGGPMGAPKHMGPMRGPSPFPPKPASQQIIGGTDLPAVYPSSSEMSLTEVVSKMMES